MRYLVLTLLVVAACAIGNDYVFTDGTNMFTYSGGTNITTMTSSPYTNLAYKNEHNTFTSSNSFQQVDATEVTISGATNVTQSVVAVSGTNYVAWVVKGSSVTNLMALEQ